MSRVQQRAGGGKVTVEGLAADVVKAGKTVTVKQGNKVVEQVMGTLQSIGDLPSFSPFAGTKYITISQKNNMMEAYTTVWNANNGVYSDQISVTNLSEISFTLAHYNINSPQDYPCYVSLTQSTSIDGAKIQQKTLVAGVQRIAFDVSSLTGNYMIAVLLKTNVGLVSICDYETV